MSAQGLPVSRLINVTVVLTPTAAQAPNLNSCLIIGSSTVIDVAQRIREYSDIDEVAADFGTTAPEFLSAELFFGQVPQPNQLFIGRWAENATPGILYGGALTPTEQLIATWDAIADGGFKIAINGGGVVSVTNLVFTGLANLNAVAAEITTRMGVAAVAATCTWDAVNARFVFTTNAGGAGDTVAFLTAAASGDTDISALLKCTVGSAGVQQVNGIAAETPLQATVILDTQSQYWYLMTFADTSLTSDQILAVATYIQSANNKHIYGVSTTDPNVPISTSTTDIAYLLKQGNFTRVVTQYSANPYAVASLLGRAVTVNFNGNSTVITLMYKQEPSVIAENLNTEQANAIDAKNCNVFVNYNNGTAIIQYGKMSSGDYFDVIQDTDWLAYSIQTAVFNLLYTSSTKVPQTDAGNHLIANAIEASCAQAVANGTLAPGQWNANGFGQLKQGDFVTKGYYIYAPPIYLQSQADREARKSVPFQVAAKLAGAIHDVDVIVNVNR